MQSQPTSEPLWYVRRDGQPLGPWPLNELRRLAKVRQLQPSDLVRPVGASNWCPATNVPGLFRRQVSLPPTVDPAGVNDDPTTPPGLPSVAGYEVLEELGRGGMGIVYRAQHLQLRRPVALKMILDDRVGEKVRERFLREARAVAKLRHPGIVQIFEVGETQGRPFFALELVPGGSLVHRLSDQPLSFTEAATIIEALARAMQVAHDAGIVHRDLKPHNVLVDADGTLKITDFGLAKDLSDDDRTRTGEVVGTVAYMAPEQARGDVKAIGPRTDVYALGVMLYQMLCGCVPFQGPTYVVLHAQMAREPDPPSGLRPGLPPDLETICLKCLAKEPGRRYRTALELAKDLKRYRRGEPVLARPVGRLEHGWRWCQRNPAVASLLAVVMLLLVLGTSVAWALAFQAERERQKVKRESEEHRKALEEVTRQKGLVETEKENARKEAASARAAERLARRRAYGTDMLLTQSAWEQSHVDRFLQLLEGQRPKKVGDEDFRSFEWFYWVRQYQRGHITLEGHTGSVSCVAFSPDGKRIVSGGDTCIGSGDDHTVKVWEADTGREIHTLKGHTEGVRSVTFSPDGKRIASGSMDKTVKLWDAQTGQETLTLKGHTLGVSSVAFSLEGKRIVSGSWDHRVKVWDAQTGSEALSLKGHTDGVTSVAISPDGKRIVSGSEDKSVKLWDAQTGQETLSLPRNGC